MITLSAAAASALADAMTTQIDAGGAAATLQVFDGTRPDTPDDVATGTILATFTLSDPVAGASVAGLATWAGMPLTATVAASGTAVWFRVRTSASAVVFDGDVGTGGADLNFDNLSWVAGATVEISSGSHAQQAG